MDEERETVYRIGDVFFRIDEDNRKSCVFREAGGGFVAHLNRDALVDLQMSLYLLWHERPRIDEVDLWSRGCDQEPPPGGAHVDLCHFYLRGAGSREQRTKKGLRPPKPRPALSGWQPGNGPLYVYLTPEEAEAAYGLMSALLEARGRFDGVRLVDGFTVKLTGD